MDEWLALVSLNKANNPIGAVQNASIILEVIKRHNPATIADVASEVDLSKSSVHNYLATLEEEDFVVRENDTYYLGLRCLDLGTVAEDRWEIRDVARSELETLANETGELVNLLVEEHGWGVYLCRERGENALTYNEYTGFRSPMYNTAAGKCILAHLPQERTERLIESRDLEPTARNTITSRDELLEELDGIRERGIAFDDEESLNGCRCVGAPILNSHGDQINGAISVSAPKTRMKGDRYREEIPDLIRSAVNVIELKVSYS